jgi:hypothetical protein
MANPVLKSGFRFVANSEFKVTAKVARAEANPWFPMIAFTLIV